MPCFFIEESHLAQKSAFREKSVSVQLDSPKESEYFVCVHSNHSLPRRAHFIQVDTELCPEDRNLNLMSLHLRFTSETSCDLSGFLETSLIARKEKGYFQDSFWLPVTY